MKAFVLDPPRCTGCEACRVACAIENRLPVDRAWRTVHHANPGHRPDAPTFHLSLACNHCARPACLEACPASAYRKDPGTGAVLLDAARCIGCRYCAWVCPYDAPRFDVEGGVMGKCTFCQDRLLEGRDPSCAMACPTGALSVETPAGALAEPVFPGLFRGGLGPALRIEGAPPRVPALARPRAEADPDEPSRRLPGKVSLRTEWTLWLFTGVGTGLVGLHLGWVLGGPRLLPPWLFLAAGALAAGLSTAHLGRPERAWRALSNLRSSWLGREILGFSLFLPAAAGSQAGGTRGLAAWLGAATGLFLLLAMDRLYQVAEQRPWWRMRSAEAVPAGLQLAALVAGWVPAFALLGVLRAWLFLAGRPSGPQRPSLMAAARLLALFLPLAGAGTQAPPGAWLACFLAGEALDRAGFYEGLAIPDPATLLGGEPNPVTSGCADPA